MFCCKHSHLSLVCPPCVHGKESLISSGPRSLDPLARRFALSVVYVLESMCVYNEMKYFSLSPFTGRCGDVIFFLPSP